MPANSELGSKRGRTQIRAVNHKALSLLQELTEAQSVPGHEDEVRAIFVDELSECGDLSTDRNGSVFCECGGDGPRVALVSGVHGDELEGLYLYPTAVARELLPHVCKARQRQLRIQSLQHGRVCAGFTASVAHSIGK